MKYKIAAVVVTFNRKRLLLNNLQSICKQTYKPECIYIVNNASTDGTTEMLNNLTLSVDYEVINLGTNLGGAGGFYKGMKIAFETNKYDAIWVMDDDGEPASNCLENLCYHLNTNEYIAPLVVSITNKDEIAFPYLSTRKINDIKIKYGENGIINNYANPFNGILFSTQLIKRIGLPKKDMFIWGDEVEYHTRITKNNIYPITIVNAIHYHPEERMILYKDFRNNKTIIYVESKLRRYCKYRNTTYTIKKYHKLKTLLFYLSSNIYFYIINRKFDLRGLSLFIKAFYDGITNNFSNHHKYIRS